MSPRSQTEASNSIYSHAQLTQFLESRMAHFARSRVNVEPRPVSAYADDLYSTLPSFQRYAGEVVRREHDDATLHMWSHAVVAANVLCDLLENTK